MLNWLVPQLTALTNVPRGTKPEIRYVEDKEPLISLYKTSFADIDIKSTAYYLFTRFITKFSGFVGIF